MAEDKIKTLEELKKIVSELKSQGKKIVHCHGVFDIVHYGHIRHFATAKKKGDVLIVTVTPDRFVNKGPGRPLFNENIRMDYLKNLEDINYIALNLWPDAIETIKFIRPDFYVKGKEVLQNSNVDYFESSGISTSNLNAEKNAVESVGGELYLTDEISFSSSSIINQFSDLLSDEIKNFLLRFREKFSTNDIVKAIESLKNIKVLLLGDAIFDEYSFCSQLGEAGKEPLVVYKNNNSEIHAGGVFAVANHLAQFTDDVTILTCIGRNNQEFINSSLNPLIKKYILNKDDSDTLIKKRYIHEYRGHKLFEVYNSDGLVLTEELENNVLEYLNKNIKDFDMIIVSDFGHGFMTKRIINSLMLCEKFLAVNAQLNGGNLGYNFITKYKRANFVSLNEKELRIPMQERYSLIDVPIKKLLEIMKIDSISLTKGRNGNTYYHNGEFYSCPSFTKDTVDTIGAGDAILAITSLLAYKRTNPEILSFIAGCSGALAVKIVGNKKPVNKSDLIKFCSYMAR